MTGYDFNEKQSGSSGVLLWIFAIVSLFMFLGVNALWASEDRWAEIAREMIQTGDYLHPAINRQIYFDKPQLSYWFIIPWAKLFGFTELAPRIPSALAALAGLFGTLALARKLFDSRTALLSGWFLASCYGFLFWGRTAAADMANMSAAVLAVAWFYHCEEKPNFLKYLLFWFIAFCGALTKGLPAVAVPVVMIMPYLFREKRFLKHLKFSNFLAFFMGLGFYFLPFILASEIPPAPGMTFPEGPVLSGLELVGRENIIRVVKAFDHNDPVYSYLYHLPRVLIPWSPFFLIAFGTAAAGYKKLYSRHQELFRGVVLCFLMFTASSSRRWYYILPLAPFCCIFTAAMFYRDPENKLVKMLFSLLRYCLIFVGACGLAAPVMLPVFKMMFKITPPLLASVAIPVAGLLILVICMMDNQPGSSVEKKTGMPYHIGSVVCGVAVVMAAVFGAVMPGMTVFRTEKPFILAARPLLAGIPEKDIVFFQTDNLAKFQYYLQWDEAAAIINKQKKGEKSRLKEFIHSRAGRRVALLCYDRPREIQPLFAELEQAQINTKELKPVLKEAGSDKQWVLFLIDVPLRKTENLKNTGEIPDKKGRKKDA